MFYFIVQLCFDSNLCAFFGFHTIIVRYSPESIWSERTFSLITLPTLALVVYGHFDNFITWLLTRYDVLFIRRQAKILRSDGVWMRKGRNPENRLPAEYGTVYWMLTGESPTPSESWFNSFDLEKQYGKKKVMRLWRIFWTTGRSINN